MMPEKIGLGMPWTVAKDFEALARVAALSGQFEHTII